MGRAILRAVEQDWRKQMMKVDLAGKRAIVTGAARGIGKATAAVLAANDADLALNDVDAAELEKTVEEIGSTGARARAFVADVGDSHQVHRMVDEIADYFNGIDILVNNAGINLPRSGRAPIHEYKDDNWRKVLKTDLDGVYYCSRAVTPHMVAAGKGKVVNIASIAGLVPLRLQSAFVAAKAGMLNLTRSMAIELGEHNINVNAIAPGSTLTEGTRSLFYSDEAEYQEQANRLLAHIPMGKPASVEDIAYAVLFLCSEEAGYITGSTLVVDGGWTAGGFVRDF